MAGEIEILEELGLTPNEAKLYLLLIKAGKLRVHELAQKSGLQRRTVYDTLAQLEKKGLAGKSEISGVLTFSPSPPSSLLAMLDEKRDGIEKILPDLTKSFDSEQKPGVSVLYGTSGMKMVLEDILALRADYCVYYGQLQIFDYLPKFFPIFNEKRKKLGIKARYILLDVPKARERSKFIPLAEFKFIDPSALSMGVWWTYADRLILFILQEELITLYIKNADLAKTFRKTFDDMFGAKVMSYTGLAGLQAIIDRTLDYKETLFINSVGKASELMPDYFEKFYIKEALKRGHKWKSIAHRVILNAPASKFPFHTFRLLPKSWPYNPSVIWIFGDFVANFVWLPTPFASVINDKATAQYYRKYFSVLWKISEKH